MFFYRSLSSRHLYGYITGHEHGRHGKGYDMPETLCQYSEYRPRDHIKGWIEYIQEILCETTYNVIPANMGM